MYFLKNVIMDKIKLVDAVKLLKTGNLAQRSTANKLLLSSVDQFSDKVIVELISLLENKDCQADAKKILLSFAHYAWYHSLHYSNAEKKLVKLMATKEYCNVADEILAVYLQRYDNYLQNKLSAEAETELVSLLVKADCSQVAQNFFWSYVEYYTNGTWGVPYYRNLSDCALTKLVGYLQDKDYRNTAMNILLRYLDNCRGYIGSYGIHTPSHSFLPKHEVELVRLLKKEDSRDMAKELLLKYFNSHNIRLSKQAEAELILLLWKKEYRETAKDILLKYAKYHDFHNVSKARFDKFLKFAHLFKTKTCKNELAYFQMELLVA